MQADFESFNIERTDLENTVTHALATCCRVPALSPDGGYVNNLPVDLMRKSMEADRIIVSIVDPGVYAACAVLM